MCIGALGVLLYLYKTSTKEKQKRLDIFRNIISLLQGNKCSFKERIGNIVYININKEEQLVLNISDDFFGVYNGIKFIEISSNDLSEDILVGIPNLIKQKFNKEINDVVYIGELAYSKNYVKRVWGEEILNALIEQNEQITISMKMDNWVDVFEEETFDLDDILDKISLSGINSLSESEKKFLQNYNREK